MAYDILPTENLKLSDIAETLIYNGGELADGISSWSDARAFFTEAANINMFSKHKPIIRAINFCQDFDESKPNYVKEWWKGTDGNCGVLPLQLSNYKLVPENTDGGRNGWQYLPPTGGESAPMRLGDFAGYYAKARLFYSDASAPEKIYKSDLSKFLVSLNEAAPNDLQLTIDDFTFAQDEGHNALSGAYAGVVITDEGGTIMARCTAAIINNGQISVDTTHLPTGTLTIYPFLSSKAIDQNSTTDDASARAYTIPYIKPITIVVEASSIEITISATMTSRYSVTWNATVVNKLSEERTLSAGVSYEKITSSGTEPQTSKTLDDVTIAANGVATLSATQSLVFALEDTPAVRVTLTLGGIYTASTDASFGL